MLSWIKTNLLYVSIGTILTLCIALSLGGLYLRTTLERNTILEAENSQKSQVIEEQSKEIEGIQAEMVLRNDLANQYREDKIKSDAKTKELQKQLKDKQNEVKDICYDLSPDPALRMYEGNSQDKD